MPLRHPVNVCSIFYDAAIVTAALLQHSTTHHNILQHTAAQTAAHRTMLQHNLPHLGEFRVDENIQLLSVF